MPEAIAINAQNGVPPLPAGGTQGQGTHNHGSPQPAYVPPAPTFPSNPVPTAPAQGGFTEEQVQARINAALAERNQPAPPAPVSAPLHIGNDSTDDPVLDSMAGLFNSAAAIGGVDIERSIGKAVAAGNVDLIDEAYIREKGGANAAHLLQIAKSMVQHISTVSTAATNAAHAAAGGKQQWDVVTAVFNNTAPAHLKAVVNKMLESGSVASVEAAAKMVVEQARSTGQVPVTPGLLSPSQGGNGSGSALDKASFQAAHAKLDRNSPTYARDRGDLFNRRQMGKQIGLN